MINYSRAGKIANLKYAFLHFYSKNKFKIYIIGFLLLLFLLTGLFTALKITDLDDAKKMIEFSYKAVSEGKIYDFSYFAKRYLSILLVMGLLFVFSLNRFVSVFGFILIGYRAFLVTLNCTLIVMHLGIGGIVNSIIIILPCHILQLVLMSILFILLCSKTHEKRTCGFIDNRKYLKWIILILATALVVNLIEFLLLLIFKATTIMVV